MVRIEPLDVLDLRIKLLLDAVRTLKRQNSMMAMQLEAAALKSEQQADAMGRWAGDRVVLREKISLVLNELSLVGSSTSNVAEVNGEE